MEILSLQYELRPALPNVYGTLDYRTFRDRLIKIDEILTNSGVEHAFILQALDQHITDNHYDRQTFFTSKKANVRYKKLKHALRCNIARHLTGESYRLFSLRLADSTLFQWFTGINDFSTRKAISKSTLERYEKTFDEAVVADKIRAWLAGLSDETTARQVGLNQAVDFTHTWMDSTCGTVSIRH